MPLQVRNIIVGAAQLFVATAENTQPVLPTIPAVGSGTSYATTMDGAAGWKNVGFTSDGLEVAYAPDWTAVEVDQLKDAAALFATGLTITVNTKLAEATLSNLLIAWGQSTTSLGTEAAGDVLGMAGGALGDFPVERSIVVVGNAPRNTVAGAAVTRRERIYHGRRVVSVSSASHNLSRSAATEFEVSFRLLPDPSYSGSEYGKIIDRTVTA